MENKGSLAIYFGEHTGDVRSKIYVNKHNIINPEINTHPRNQRKIARDIAWRVMNAEQDITLLTCSDFIIKELNLLIKFNRKEEPERMLEIARKNGYSEKEFLDYSIIQLYIISQDNIEAQLVTEEGICLPCLDDVIVKMNKIEDDIIFGG